MTADDRGQAYTLEALIGAILILTAVLFALNSVVITPTTAGTLDRGVQEERVGQAEDALQIAQQEGELSRMVRYYNGTTVDDDPVPAGATTTGGYSREDGIPPAAAGRFGEVLNRTFTGQQYNVEVIPLRPGGTPDRRDGGRTQEFFSQGDPTNQAVTASVTVVLYDDQKLTGPGERDTTLADADSDTFPFENIDPDNEVYTVVEVRITVW